MKTAILTTALIVLMTVAQAMTITDTVNSPANEEQAFKAWVIKPDAHIIKFRVKNPAEEKVVLKIYNDRDVKIFHRTIRGEKEKNISCEMSNCGPGTFTCVVLRNGHEEYVRTITLD